ncbi:MAG: KilA-N domain-containing protein [Desulfuromonadaceae bacterium]|nr:KilA-N domain-containing protein [Desulfuromonadaceae bacterium]
MSKNSQIVVLNETIRIQRIDQDDFISLTDIAKFKNADDPRFVIQNWMRTRSSIEFLGIWKMLNNPNFNRVEFDTVKNQSGSKGNKTIESFCAEHFVSFCAKHFVSSCAKHFVSSCAEHFVSSCAEHFVSSCAEHFVSSCAKSQDPESILAGVQ